jgi:hypothetical protein
MPILKFRKNGRKVALEKLRMEDITEDKRTAFLDRGAFMSARYRVDNDVYIAKNDLFFKMAKMLNASRTRIDAMLIRDDSGSIIIVPNKSYVFWNGRSVEPEKYTVLQTPENMQLQNQICGNISVRK